MAASVKQSCTPQSCDMVTGNSMPRNTLRGDTGLVERMTFDSPLTATHEEFDSAGGSPGA